MSRYICKHMLQVMIVLIGITFLTFLILYLAPGDPAQVKLSAQGTAISSEVLEQMREEMGLNTSFLTQYKNWIWNAMHGDLGNSYQDNQPVLDKLLTAFWHTLKLSLMALISSVIIAIPVALLTAVKKNSYVDKAIRLISFIGNSIPNFITAILLIYLFCIQLNWFPVLADESLRGMFLPAIALAIPLCSRFITQFREAFQCELNKEYVIGAKVRGVSFKVILLRDVLHNALITILTIISMSIGTLMGGSVVIETIFLWPGVGKLVMNAISMRDYPLIQGFVIMMAIIYVTIHYITEFSYQKLDPRVRSR